jgi:hypothetical protein
MVVRIHNVPRRALFDVTTCDDPPPVALNHIDVKRHTITSLDTADEKDIHDFADGTITCRRELSDPWVGETRYQKLWRTPEGYDMIDGRMTRIQTTTRPPDIWPEMWQAMSKKHKEKAILEWSAYKKLLDEARQRRGLIIGVDGGDPVAPGLLASADDEESRRSIAESKAWINGVSPFPACPVMPLGPVQQEHREKDQSPFNFADLSCLVAKQISIKEAK